MISKKTTYKITIDDILGLIDIVYNKDMDVSYDKKYGILTVEYLQ